MRYKRSTYIAINVNIQNINIFFYLISLLRNKFPFTQKRPRKKSGARCSWKRVKKSKQFVDMFTLLAYWLSPFFLALLPRQIGYMPILSPDFNTHHGHTRTMIIEPVFLPFRVIAKEKIICSELGLFDLCIFIFFAHRRHWERKNMCVTSE